MDLFQKLTRLRLLFQALLICNLFFIAWGGVALVRYFQEHQTSALELVFVGGMTFIFGFLLPAVVFYFLVREMNQMRRKVEERIVALVVGWMDGVKAGEEGFLKNPFFWANLGLSLLEVLIKDVKHPAVGFLMEISPVFRSEIHKRLHKKPSQ